MLCKEREVVHIAVGQKPRVGAAFVGHEGGASDVANPGKPAFKEIERRLEHCRVIAM